MGYPNKYITSAKFQKLKVGDKIVIRFMIGDAYVANKPIMNPEDPEAVNTEVLDVRFESGPWKGKTLNLCRQQVSNTGLSFPPR